MDIVLQFVLLTAGILLLLKGADYFVKSASAFADQLAVPKIVIGLTIVAFGTSTPELIVNIFASIEAKDAITIGNVVGSNIINILLILGISGVIAPIIAEKNTVWREIPFSLLAVVIMIFAVSDSFLDGNKNLISRSDGLQMLGFFVIFLTYVFGISKLKIRDEPEVEKLSKMKTGFLMLLGLTGLILGGKLVVDSAVDLARHLEISEKVISLTIVALGTSLPELFTSAVAAYRKMYDMAIGNIVGSNIFNIFFITGISAVIHPVAFESGMMVDLIVLLIATLILFMTMFTGKRKVLERWEAIIMLVIYFGYVTFLLLRG